MSYQEVDELIDSILGDLENQEEDTDPYDPSVEAEEDPEEVEEDERPDEDSMDCNHMEGDPPFSFFPFRVDLGELSKIIWTRRYPIIWPSGVKV